MTNATGRQASGAQVPDDAGCGTAGHTEPSTVLGTVIGFVRPIVRSASSLLVELLDRIVHGIRCMAPFALGFGCQSTTDVVDVAPHHESAPASAGTADTPTETGPRQLGQFTITFYYVIGEDEVKPRVVAANDNRGTSSADGESELAAIAPDLVTLYAGGGACRPIAEVSKEFASQVAVQGTGKLHDGRMVNIWGACNCKHSPCFTVTQTQWGTAGSGKPLQPFRTVAVDPRVVKLGSLLHVPLLEGRTMPGRPPWGGYVHDGCVIADDTGGHIAGNRLDLFVGRRAYFLGLSGSGSNHHWARHVPVFDGTGICERKGRRIGRKAGAI
jgi:3D (Asp-Asp-Asp) domain-containing protein